MNEQLWHFSGCGVQLERISEHTQCIVKMRKCNDGHGGGAVESLNKGHLRTASFVLCEEVVLSGRFKMYWNYREKILGVTTCVLCREAFLTLKRPLSEIPLHMIYRLHSLRNT